MKITKSQLRQIIEEEIKTLNENLPGFQKIKSDSLEKDDWEELSKLNKILGRKANHFLHDGGEIGEYRVAFAYTAPLELGTSQLKKLANEQFKVVIKKDYIYIIAYDLFG